METTTVETALLRDIEAALRRDIVELQDEQPSCNDNGCAWGPEYESGPRVGGRLTKHPARGHSDDCFFTVQPKLLARVRAALAAPQSSREALET